MKVIKNFDFTKDNLDRYFDFEYQFNAKSKTKKEDVFILKRRFLKYVVIEEKIVFPRLSSSLLDNSNSDKMSYEASEALTKLNRHFNKTLGYSGVASLYFDEVNELWDNGEYIALSVEHNGHSYSIMKREVYQILTDIGKKHPDIMAREVQLSGYGRNKTKIEEGNKD